MRSSIVSLTRVFRILVTFIVILTAIYPSYGHTLDDRCRKEMAEVSLRIALPEDAIDLSILDRKVWGHQMAASPEKLISRIETFPEGQIVATSDGVLIGFINSQKTSKSIQYIGENKTWPQVTGNGFIDETHNPAGKILFLINLTVDFDAKQVGQNRSMVGAQLVKEALKLARMNGITEVEGITRLNGFKKYVIAQSSAGNNSPENVLVSEYLNKVESGNLRDPALSFHLAQGAEVKGPIKDAMPDDIDSLQWGALIVYHTH